MGFIVTAGANGRKPPSPCQHLLLQPLPYTSFTRQQPSFRRRVTEPTGSMRVWLVFLLLLVGACPTPLRRPAETGHLEVEWGGPDRGKISAPATAEWCAPR